MDHTGDTTEEFLIVDHPDHSGAVTYDSDQEALANVAERSKPVATSKYDVRVLVSVPLALTAVIMAMAMVPRLILGTIESVEKDASIHMLPLPPRLAWMLSLFDKAQFRRTTAATPLLLEGPPAEGDWSVEIEHGTSITIITASILLGCLVLKYLCTHPNLGDPPLPVPHPVPPAPPTSPPRSAPQPRHPSSLGTADTATQPRRRTRPRTLGPEDEVANAQATIEAAVEAAVAAAVREAANAVHAATPPVAAAATPPVPPPVAAAATPPVPPPVAAAATPPVPPPPVPLPPVELIDINTCTDEQLQQTHGIGPIISAAVVAARPFEAVTLEQQLRAVTGVGPTRCAALLARFHVPVVMPQLQINTCERTELEAVTGIGPALSGRIVAARPFHLESIETQLRDISGIGPVRCAAVMTHFGMVA